MLKSFNSALVCTFFEIIKIIMRRKPVLKEEKKK